jgi:hypothetical protein
LRQRPGGLGRLLQNVVVSFRKKYSGLLSGAESS